MRIISFLVIFFVLLALGCVGAGKVEYTNEGVVIDYIKAVPEKVYRAESFDVEVELKNVGNAPAKGTLYIYGPAWLKDESESNVFKQEFELRGAYPENNIPGESKLITGSFKAEAWSQDGSGSSGGTGGDAESPLYVGMSQDYEIYARACYSYSTNYSAIISYTSRSEQVFEDKKVKLVDEENSRAPIKIKLIALPEYIKHQTGELIFVLRVENAGSGFPASLEGECKHTPSFEEANKIEKLEIISNVGKVSCETPKKDAGESSENKNDIIYDLYLSEGRANVRCSISGLPRNVPELQIN